MAYRIIGEDKKEYGPVQLDEVREWIREGCPTPEDEAKCVKLEILPGGSKLLNWPEFNRNQKG